MAQYIDGFVFPISKDKIEEYSRVAEAVAEIYKQHGAVDYCEFIGDDMIRKGTRHFPEALGAVDDEAIVFGWVTFESRESRDQVNRNVEADPRMAGLLAPLLDPDVPIFDAQRMAYGGFRPLVSSQELTS